MVAKMMDLATLASGVLMGLSEGMQQPEPPAPARRRTKSP
jgi:hypothetical protein